MKTSMYQKIQQLLNTVENVHLEDTVDRTIAEIAIDGATEKQAAELVENWPAWFKKGRNGKVSLRKCSEITPPPQIESLADLPGDAEAAPEVAEPIDPNAEVVNTVEATMGAYGHEHAAAVEAQQLQHPNVFQYRSGIFPDPRTFHVEVKVTEATPVQLEGANPLYPWGVQLKMEIRGKSADTDGWVTRFRDMARMQLVG